MSVEKVRKIYLEAFSKHGNDLKSIFIPKGRQKERFDSIVRFFENKPRSVLDFGCGLGHFSEYISQHFNKLNYYGCDILAEFVEQSKINFPQSNFFGINDFKDLKANYDYIAAIGVFNIIYFQDTEKNKKYLFECIAHLFEKTNIVLAINFMNTNVDFVQPNAYHQDIGELVNYVSKNLSKRFLVDNTYMPYEFTITIFKNCTIIKPDNIFEKL